MKKINRKKYIKAVLIFLLLIILFLLLQYLYVKITNPKVSLEKSDRGMVVKYTIVDKELSKKYDTIDDIMTKNIESLIYNSYGFETLVKVNDTTYEGKLSNANDELLNNITDYVFAKRDTYGNVIKDATYDPKTKKITIPAKYVEKETIQMQVLVKSTTDKIVNTKIKTETPNGKKEVTLNGFDSQSYITLANYDSNKKISKENIDVYVNNKYKMNDDSYSYDLKSKTLKLNLNPLLANSVKVVVNKKSIIDKIVNTVSADDIRGDAVESEDADGIKLKSAPSLKQGDTGNMNIRWAYNSTAGYPVGSDGYSRLATNRKMNTKEEKAEAAKDVAVPAEGFMSPEQCGSDYSNCPERKVVTDIINDKKYVMGFIGSNVTTNEYNNNLKNMDSRSDNFIIEHTDGDVEFAFRLEGLGLEFETPNSVYNDSAFWVSAYCLHITNAANQTDITSQPLVNVNYRVLYKDDNVMILQVYMNPSDDAGTQTAYGVYKFYWEDTSAAIEVEKHFYDGSNDVTSEIKDKSGIEFTLYSSKTTCQNGTKKIESKETNSNGKLTYNDLKTNKTYYIKETSLGKNFSSNDWNMDKSCQAVKVTSNDSMDSTNTFRVKKKERINRKKYYCVQIEKTSANNSDIKLQGIQFKITNKTTNGSITGTTNNQGKILFSKLKYSKKGYDIVETSSNPSKPSNQSVFYWNDNSIPTTKSINVTSDEMTYDKTTKEYTCSSNPTKYTFKDKPVYYCLKVKKVDKITGVVLSGAEFTAKLGSNEYKATTGSDGIATFVVGTNSGTYTVTETKAPEGYALPSTVSKQINASKMPQSTEYNQRLDTSKCTATAIQYEDNKYVLNWYKETEDGTKASGAKFKVRYTDSSNSTHYVIAESTKVNHTDSSNVIKKCYVYKGLTTDKTKATEFVSDTNGETCISGIINNGKKMYSVEETESAKYHTFGKDKVKQISMGTLFISKDVTADSNTNKNKFVNYDTEFEFTKTVSSGDEENVKIIVNGKEKTLKDLTTEELKLLEFNVTDKNNKVVSFILENGIYEYAGNTIDKPTGTPTTALHLDNNRKIKIKHLPKGTYYIKEKNGKSCDSSSSYNDCIGYYYPSYTSDSSYKFTITECSSTNATSCTTHVSSKQTLENKPTEITFTKKDFYNYYDAADKNKSDSNVTFENDKERNDFDKIVFKIKDSKGNYLTLKKVRDVGDCSTDSSYSEYRYVKSDQTDTKGTELHTCGGHIKITNLCRGNEYTVEEVSVPDGSVYVKENTESTPTSVKYKIPCTEGDKAQSSTTNLISDKPTRVRFEKRDSKYNYLIQDETTTFEVYKCAKGTECHPSDYATKEEREKNGMTLVKFNPRAIITGDEEDSTDAEGLQGVEVYRKISDSDVSKGTKYVTNLHPYNGILVLRYLESNYRYVLLETVAPKNYSLPSGRNAETGFTVTNTTVKVDEVDVPNKPTSLIIRKYSDTGELLPGAEFKIYEGKTCNANLSAMNQPKTLLKLKTIRDGVYENRPTKDTDTILTCTDRDGEKCSEINTKLTYKDYSDSWANFDETLNTEKNKVEIKQGEALIQYLEYDHCYIIEEVKAPKGYSLPKNEEDRYTMVTIPKNTEYASDTYKTLINKPTPFTFYKYDEYNKLLDGAEFKLQKLDDNKKYHDIAVTREETETGVYYKANESSDNKIITTVNGSATVYYLEEGQYRIVEVTPAPGKELGKNPNIATFFVDNSGNVYGNSIIVNKSKTEKIEVKSSASAELVVSIQTGQKVIRYGLIIATIASVIIALMIMLRMYKKQSE